MNITILRSIGKRCSYVCNYDLQRSRKSIHDLRIWGEINSLFVRLRWNGAKRYRKRSLKRRNLLGATFRDNG